VRIQPVLVRLDADRTDQPQSRSALEKIGTTPVRRSISSFSRSSMLVLRWNARQADEAEPDNQRPACP
jgi:hypothetical protein